MTIHPTDTALVLMTDEYGKDWSEKELSHCLRVAESFSDEAILSALWRELSWTHIKTLIGLILCTRKKQKHVELLQLDKSNIRVADYLTLLPPRELFEAKLHLSIEIARQRLAQGDVADDGALL